MKKLPNILLILMISQTLCVSILFGDTVSTKLSTDVKVLFDKYWHICHPPAKLKTQKQDISTEFYGRTVPCYPGYIAESWDKIPKNFYRQNWPFRNVTYEIYFPTRRDVGSAIYGLALFTKDLNMSVSLERFKRGASGFHYGINQIVDWANAVFSGAWQIYTVEEQKLLNHLINDHILILINSRYISIGLVRHVLGVSPTPKRSIELNLNHERLHVMWDEDVQFRDNGIQKWRLLSDEKKQAFRMQLKGYNLTNELQIIEEWTVRRHENRPFLIH